MQRSYAVAGVNVIAADTDAEAKRLFTSAQQRACGIFRGARGLLPPPIDAIDAYWSPAERIQVERMLACSFVGSAETIRHGLADFIARTGVDEVIVAAAIFDHGARVRSYEILDGVARSLA